MFHNRSRPGDCFRAIRSGMYLEKSPGAPSALLSILKPVPFLLLAFLVQGMGSRAAARTWYVLPDSTGDAPNIQAAIDSSGDGDSVLVAAGLYYVNLQITGIEDFTLVSESGPEVTFLDGSPAHTPQNRQIIRLLQSPNALIEGFTIQNANPSPVVNGWGGGIRISGGGRVTIRGNIIRWNTSRNRGGGLAFSNPCDGCGGSVIEENQFIENTCEDNAAGIWSTGVTDGTTYIRNNLFQGNVGGYAGIRTEYSSINVKYNHFINNVSTSYCLDIVGPGRAENNLVIQNDGGGICVGSGVIASNTVVDNSWVGINAMESNTYNNTVTGNLMGIGNIYAEATTCNNSWGNVEWNYMPGGDSCGMNGNICENPLFCDPDNGDYSIAAESPCAPENSGGCGLIGALGVDCVATSVPNARRDSTSWGSLKRMFR